MATFSGGWTGDRITLQAMDLLLLHRDLLVQVMNLLLLDRGEQA